MGSKEKGWELILVEDEEENCGKEAETAVSRERREQMDRKGELTERKDNGKSKKAKTRRRRGCAEGSSCVQVSSLSGRTH